MSGIPYDLESYPNLFSAVFLHDQKFYTFEISWRKNETTALRHFRELHCLDSTRLRLLSHP